MARIVSDSVDIPTATTRVQLNTSTVPVLSIIFKAKPANSGLIFIGDVTVSATVGFELAAGESLTLPISDYVQANGAPHTIPLSDFYADTSNSGDDVDYIALVE